jgi:hypothetical protein
LKGSRNDAVVATVSDLAFIVLYPMLGSFAHDGAVLPPPPHGKQWKAVLTAGEWQVGKVVALLREALQPEEVVLGGGNVKKLKKRPPGTRLGSNENAFRGGFELWNEGADDRRFRS